MLKGGVFTTPTSTYLVYEIDERGFYRIDFLKEDGVFNVNPEDVVYSQVKRKTTYEIGNSDVYNDFLKQKEILESAQYKDVRNASWEDGTYVVKIHSENTKFSFVKETTLKNGITWETNLLGNGYSISMFVLDAIYGIKTEPLNMSEYHSLTLSNDTVQTSTGSLFYSLDVLKRRYDLSHIEEKNYVVATDIETARQRLKEFKENPYPFKGFDTETTGVDVDLYGDDHLVGVILGSDPNTATYFPFRHKGDFNLPIEFLKELMDVFKPFESVAVAHNKKFDRKVMLKEGYDIRIKWDTMQLSIILNPTIGKGIHGEKYLTYQLNGKHFLELDEIFINSKDIDFSVLPVDIIRYYACPDGTNVLDLLKDMLERLPEYQYRLALLECDLADVKADMEYYGIRVDTKKFEKQYQNCNYILDMLIKAFRTLTHEDGNINSSDVLSNLIYNKMHCPVLLRTKKGKASTSMAAINKLANVQAKTPSDITVDLVDLYGNVVIKASTLANSAHPALVILKKYKEYIKLKTAFYARFERTMSTGRVFFWVNQNGAATGRQSSPMHQLPPDLKEVILADADDRDFWGPDFSQIELRMIAYLAKETELINLAKDPDNDIHRIIGSLISNKPMWSITPQERSLGKRRNFGVVYLISKFGLAGQMFGPGYTKENVDFAAEQLDAFYHRFKRIDRYIKHNAALVQKKGYMETAWYHRRRLFKEILDTDIEPAKRASILRMANNVPVQGTAADYLKLAEVQMYNWIRMKGWNELKDGFPRVRMMLSIHDEIIISADNTIPYEEIIEMITKCMETPVEDAPPFFVQPARMDNWEGHSDDSVAMPIRFRDQVIEEYHKTGKSIFKQSYFKLTVPPEVTQALSKEAGSMKDIVEKYLDQVTLTFDHGDFVTKYLEDHKKDALKKYIESGFTMYRIDNYIDLLNEFRQGQLRDYMSDLINKYGHDYKAVGEHVRHPSLTFDLIDNYKRQIPKDLEHVDQITEAARLYLEDVESGNIEVSNKFTVDLKENVNVATDKDTFTEQLEPLVEFDKDGNAIFDNEAEETEDLFNWFDDSDDVIDLTKNKPVFAWELADIIALDVQSMNNEDINKVLSYTYNYNKKDGFYKVMLIMDGKDMIDSTIRVDNINMDELNNTIVQLVQSETGGVL